MVDGYLGGVRWLVDLLCAISLFRRENPFCSSFLAMFTAGTHKKAMTDWTHHYDNHPREHKRVSDIL